MATERILRLAADCPLSDGEVRAVLRAAADAKAAGDADVYLSFTDGHVTANRVLIRGRDGAVRLAGGAPARREF